jgi:hypothetical protein
MSDNTKPVPLPSDVGIQHRLDGWITKDGVDMTDIPASVADEIRRNLPPPTEDELEIAQIRQRMLQRHRDAQIDE